MFRVVELGLGRKHPGAGKLLGIVENVVVEVEDACIPHVNSMGFLEEDHLVIEFILSDVAAFLAQQSFGNDKFVVGQRKECRVLATENIEVSKQQQIFRRVLDQIFRPNIALCLRGQQLGERVDFIDALWIVFLRRPVINVDRTQVEFSQPA